MARGGGEGSGEASSHPCQKYLHKVLLCDSVLGHLGLGTIQIGYLGVGETALRLSSTWLCMITGMVLSVSGPLVGFI
jgi:hypothetical protein